MSRWVEATGSTVIRRSAVAGSFYPASPERLRMLVRELFEAAARLPGVPGAAGPAADGAPAGLLVPHAGLVYSGVTATAAWRSLAGHGRDVPTTVVLLGTNHGAAWLDGVGVWNVGAWDTPLGQVQVDEPLAAAIVALGPPFQVDLEAHDLEHSVEVQLPLLRHVAPGARIVPLAVSCGRGPWAVETGARLGALLQDRRTPASRVVLVISTDMAHYPPAATCERTTAALLPSILAVDPGALADREAAIRDPRVHGLSCGMCGIEPAVVGLAALRAMGATRATHLASSTSADAGGPTDRTVGYLAVRFDA